VQFLGLATILMGAFTGTFFGVNLLGEQFAWLGRAQDFMIDSNQAFNVALILGLAQMLFGLAVQTVNRYKQYGFQYALPTVGWIILLLSILDLALLKQTGLVSTWTAWTGVGMIVLFSDPKAGILGRIGKGLWDLYGITGFFGDLLSYIRLFALGISSAILGFVVNDIALQIKGVAPIIGPILFVVFLIVGHGANLLIASLGAFVHPMRLTFVEFYKNAGFEGGGKAYTPFARRIKKEK
jgi:V/A-type H+/Na+-transporting ATPase subunit I